MMIWFSTENIVSFLSIAPYNDLEHVYLGLAIQMASIPVLWDHANVEAVTPPYVIMAGSPERCCVYCVVSVYPLFIGTYDNNLFRCFICDEESEIDKWTMRGIIESIKQLH